MTTFELNIGLLVGTDENALENSWAAVSGRANSIEKMLQGQLTCRVRRHWSFDQEPTLVVLGSVSSDDPGGFHQWLYQLAEAYHQDCIAVYYPGEDKGYLVGPHADAWGDFQDEYFVHYFE